MATEIEKPRKGELKPREKSSGGGFFQRLFQEPGSLFGKTGGPAMDVIDRASEILVRADLPGLDQSDISVEIDGRTLTIWGERHEEREERDESYYYSERWAGTFKRSVDLPEGVDPKQARASFEAGVLEVCFPKTAPKRTGRRIEVSGPSDTARTPRAEAGEVASPPSGVDVAQPAEEGARAYEPQPPSGARRIDVTEPEAPQTRAPYTSPEEDLGRH